MPKKYQSMLVALVVIAYIAPSVEAQVAAAQPAQTLSVSPDSPRWELEGQAKTAEYQGRKCLFLDGGAAIVKDFEMRDGVIDVDVATPAKPRLFRLQFRMR